MTIGNISYQSKVQTPDILIKEITDLYIRKNFQSLSDYFNAQNQLVNFNFLELNITSAVTNQKFRHNLVYTPKDIIISQITGVGSCAFNYGNFDSTNIDVTTTGACRVRLFVGTYYGDTSTVTAKSTDSELMTALPLVNTGGSSVSVIGDYTALGTERLILIQSQSQGGNALRGSVTLPAASTLANTSLWIQKTDANFSPIQITSVSTILPDNALTTQLSTQWERVLLFSNGTSWYVLVRDYPRTWQPFPTGLTLLFQGLPNLINSVLWRRDGGTIFITSYISAKGAATLSPFLLSVPAQIVADTSQLVGLFLSQMPLSIYQFATPQATYGTANLVSGVNNQFFFTTVGNTVDFWGATLNGHTVSGTDNFTINLAYPVQGWKG